MDFAAADDGQTVPLKLGDTITIRLPENPTTGFRWELQPLDANVLTLADDGYESGGSLPGAGGVRVLRLQAVNPGKHDVVLRLRRAWENASPIGTYRLIVTVG